MVLGVSHFVGMALQNTLPWTSLAILLRDLSPTLIEAREVINILLKELETLQSSLQRKQNELESYQKGNLMTSVESEVNNYQELDNSLQNELVVDDEGQFNFLPEIQTSDDELEVLEVVKEKFNDEMSFDFSNENEVDMHEVKNKECVLGNEITDNIFHQLENEWYTFVTNDKTSTSENKRIEENEQISIQRLNEKKKIKKTSIKVKKFNCATCQKQFRDRWNLANHERIHTGEAPYMCNYCKKRFKTKYELKNHERIHTGEKPYQCETCNKRFSQTSSLKTHEKIHTGEFPFDCKTCKKSFRLKPQLKVHERIHKKNAI